MLPIWLTLNPESSLINYGVAFELWHIDLQSSLLKSSEKVFFLYYVWTSPSAKTRTTDIKFLVSVPVLSEQMLSAPPMVSQACKYLTKLFYYFIFPTLYANAIVTARGNPYGTATTIILTAIMKASTICNKVSNLNNWLIKFPDA